MDRGAATTPKCNTPSSSEFATPPFFMNIEPKIAPGTSDSGFIRLRWMFSPLSPPMESCPDFDVGNTFGALLIGAIISYTLLGISTIQVHMYFKRFPQDSLKVKCMVGGVWLGEIGQSISFAIALYTVLITNFGHPERLSHFPTSLIVSACLASLVTFTVQIFFAYRIYTLSKSLYIPTLCWMLSLFRLIPSNVILFGGIHDPGEILNRWSTLFNAIWVVSALNDILVAGTMVVLLRERQARVLERTSAVVDKLITWTIETGMVTSICSIIMVVVFLTLRTTRESYLLTFISSSCLFPWLITVSVVWLAIWVVIPRLFSNSLLASLNSRASLRSALLPTHPSSSEHNRDATITSRNRPVQIAVEMTKVVGDPYDD
ncbi:hypothetical protein R3P38DRAFT_3266922 [Favolaschia claudopus]|uniref:DUF6534 domain-containing protein n=1 Tax=Favolaschia claudopus TaxID=2862362 RepID=A0AAW0BVT5_9AGAR